MSREFILASGSLRRKDWMNRFRTNLSSIGKVDLPDIRSTALVIPRPLGHDSHVENNFGAHSERLQLHRLIAPLVPP